MNIDLFAPVSEAEDLVARLDERIASSPIADGWRSRTHFADACASLWVDGGLVHLEDLVLHDAAMDIRAPSAELVRAHAALRSRRRILAAEPGWALSDAGMAALLGRPALDTGSAGAAAAPMDAIAEEEEAFAAEMAAIDAAIARSEAVLAGAVAASREDTVAGGRDGDEIGRMAEWRGVVDGTLKMPPVLAAAIAAEAWERLAPIENAGSLGRLLTCELLRSRGKTRSHLVCLNSGLKAVPRDRRRHRDRDARIAAWIAAIASASAGGLRDHDRWLAAKRQLERRLVGRRSSSHLPGLVELVTSVPVASSGMIAERLAITPRAAQDLVKQLDLREVTGRGRYRAWGIL